MRYFLIAGERSGDLHAGNLAKAIMQNDGEAIMSGYGGDYMTAAGVEIKVHYKEIAIMGFLEVLTNLRKISRHLKRCKLDIQSFKPDVIVLIDFGGFNKRIAAWAKKERIKVYYYISPKVWAWNQKRALKLKATVDKMFVILPFEKEFYKKFDWEVDYVGNPVMDAVKAHKNDPGFLKKYQLPEDRPIVALLPGSRKQELLKVSPTMAAVTKLFPNIHFAVATVSNLDKIVYDELLAPNVTFVLEDTYNLLQHSTAAVVTSGTATLETALFKVPQVVVYNTSFISYKISKMLIMVPFISLVNLVAGREVVRELIQYDFTADKVSDEIKRLLDGPKRKAVLDAYEEIWHTFDIGSASENAARLMAQYLKAG